MPNIKTLDMGRTGIRQLTDDSFRVNYLLPPIGPLMKKYIAGFKILTNAGFAR